MVNEIKQAIEYFAEIRGAISFIKPPKKRQEGVFKTALAALKTMEWINNQDYQRYKSVTNPADLSISEIQTKYKEFKKGE